MNSDIIEWYLREYCRDQMIGLSSNSIVALAIRYQGYVDENSSIRIESTCAEGCRVGCFVGY